jgi:SWI/SNF related-matrix-associated actin-dependent regulator of chromatin subfamily C
MDFGSTGGPSSMEHSLQRDEAAGMNPTHILTGFGVKGEKRRHVVLEGALRLPKSALDIMETSGRRNQQDKYTLPGLDSVARPSRDSLVTDMTVTEIYGVVLPEDPINMLPERLQCYARNRDWVNGKTQPEVERIRGGGDSDNPQATSGPLETASQSNDLQTLASPTDDEQMQVETTESKDSSSRKKEEPNDGVSSRSEKPGSPDAPVEAPLASESLPATITSGNPPPVPPSTRSLPEVLPLTVKPEPQWHQHAPGSLDPTQPDSQAQPTHPDWFETNHVSQLERSVLLEWFDGSALHRSEKSYLASRNRMIDMSSKLADRYVTTTMIRRSIPGDVGSLMRMYNFLTAYGLINKGALNDTTPTPVTLQESKAKYRWSEPLQQELLRAVVEESRKRRRLNNPAAQDFEPVIDWDTVANKLGHGVSPTDCERQFLAMPIADSSGEGSATTGETAMNDSSEVGEAKPSDDDSARAVVTKQQQLLQDVMDLCDAKVVHDFTNAAFSAESGSTVKIQGNAVVGLVTHHALHEATSKDEKVSRIMAEIVDLRMKKLENRLALLDDVEGLLDSERVSLELERRDLYTARCRHWYGGV